MDGFVMLIGAATATAVGFTIMEAVPRRQRLQLLGAAALAASAYEVWRRMQRPPEVRRATKLFPSNPEKITPSDKDAAKRLMVQYKRVVEQFLNDKVPLALQLNAKLMQVVPEGSKMATHVRELQILIETALTFDEDQDRKKFIQDALGDTPDWRQNNGLPALEP